jgi:hypothetical protein
MRIVTKILVGKSQGKEQQRNCQKLDELRPKVAFTIDCVINQIS